MGRRVALTVVVAAGAWFLSHHREGRAPAVAASILDSSALDARPLRPEASRSRPYADTVDPATTATSTTAAPVVAASGGPAVRVPSRRASPPTPAPRRTTPTVAAPAVSSSSASTEAMPALLRRIGGCESGTGPNGPLIWTAHNRYSTASGAFEYLDSTWSSYGGYSRAMYAPPEVQLRRAEADFAAWQRQGGAGPWYASRSCWA